jgi:predicted amidohydrolase YtcJ
MTLVLGGCSPSSDESASKSVAKNSSSQPAVVADVVYTNGIIYTVNEAQPWAEAVAIKDGKFVVVGSVSDVEDETGGHTAWFNTKAMEAAGLTKEFVDTPEIFYSRTEDGDIKGLAFEGGLNAFYAAMPPFDTNLRKIAYMKLLDEATSKGITAVGDAYVFEPDLQAYQELENKWGQK